jgi:cysteine-rich repeat protein
VDRACDNSGLAVTLSFSGGFVNALICGAGFAEGPEQCDDSNASGPDGCSQTCRTEYSYTFSGTTEEGSVDLVIDGIQMS